MTKARAASGFAADPTRLDKTPGMHRFTWDLRYPGPWQSSARPEGPNGPVAVPGKYSVRLTVGSWTATQPLTVIEDPRVTKIGVTIGDLREQFEHNMRVRDLVSDVNQTVARVRAAQAARKIPRAGSNCALAPDHAVHPLQQAGAADAHHVSVQLTNSTDQKIGRDAVERYACCARNWTSASRS